MFLIRRKVLFSLCLCRNWWLGRRLGHVVCNSEPSVVFRSTHVFSVEVAVRVADEGQGVCQAKSSLVFGVSGAPHFPAQIFNRSLDQRTCCGLTG